VAEDVGIVMSDKKKSLMCRIGFHKSDKDYGMKGIGGAVISTCERCGKQLTHKKMRWA
jgi:hypothetical protein